MSVTSQTSASFSTGQTAGGDLQIARLDQYIEDRSQNSGNTVEYRIYYDVILESGFEGIRITARNLSENAQEVYEPSDKDGYLQYEYKNGYGDEFEFTFEVFATDAEGSTSVLLEEHVSDTADGTNPSNNDEIGNPDDPKLSSVTLEDNSTEQNKRVHYYLTYSLSNTDNFDGDVRVTLKNSSSNGKKVNEVYPDTYPDPREIYYDSNNTYKIRFEITVEVVRSDGFVYDRHVFYDEPGGEGHHWTA